MRLLWAVVAGIVAGAAVAWWLGREAPELRQAREQRAQAAAEATREESRRVLYRWRSADGVRQLTDSPPPPGVAFEKIDIHGHQGIVVDGSKR